MPFVPISRSVALALATALAVGCDAEPDAADVADAPATPERATPGAGAPPATVPTRFRGSYAADRAACDAPGDPTQLAIGTDTIGFHESSGPVTGVASGPSDITITAELTGEGETREATYRFRLADDGGTLTDIDAGMERVRCDNRSSAG